MPRPPKDVPTLIQRLEAAARAALDSGDREAFNIAAGLVLLARWAGEEALTATNSPRKLTRMETSPSQPRRVGRPRTSPHAFPAALEAAGTTVTAWAAHRGLKRTVVTSWYAPRPHGRAIPARYAAEIEREYKIPPGDWPNGVRS